MANLPARTVICIYIWHQAALWNSPSLALSKQPNNRFLVSYRPLARRRAFGRCDSSNRCEQGVHASLLYAFIMRSKLLRFWLACH